MDEASGASVPEVDLSDPAVARDPFTTYGHAREQAPVARISAPGFGPMWAFTRYAGAQAMLSDPRFAMETASFLRPDVPEDCVPYMRTMSEMEGTEHRRLRKLVSPAFTARRAAEFKPRIEPIVHALLDALPAGDGQVDLLEHFAKPLPMEVICELVGIPDADRARWRDYGAAVAAGSGPGFAEAVPGIMQGAAAAIEARRAEPRADVLTNLIRVRDDESDRLSDDELVTLVWHLVIAGQTPTNVLANAVAALHAHPEQAAGLAADPDLLPRAVEEFMRWCGSAILAIPRYAQEDVELFGVLVRKGEAVTATIAAANRDPRVYTDPERLDLGRAGAPHIGFGYGPHFCLGAALARAQLEVALGALLQRFPALTVAAPIERLRAPDPGTWRLTSLPVTL